MQTTKNDAVPLLGQTLGKTLGVLEEQALFNVCHAVTQGLQHPLPQDNLDQNLNSVTPNWTTSDWRTECSSGWPENHTWGTAPRWDTSVQTNHYEDQKHICPPAYAHDCTNIQPNAKDTPQLSSNKGLQTSQYTRILFDETPTTSTATQSLPLQQKNI